MKRTISRMGDKTLEELTSLTEDEKAANAFTNLFGTVNCRDSTVVVLLPSGMLQGFKLDPEKKTAQETSLPAWARDTHVAMMKANFKNRGNRKRGRGNDRGSSSGRGTFKRNRKDYN